MSKTLRNKYHFFIFFTDFYHFKLTESWGILTTIDNNIENYTLGTSN